MDLTIFDNQSGEGVIAFEPWRMSGSEYEADHSRWYCHLTVAGKRVFEYGCPCGTCGIVFRKVGSTEHRVSDSEAHQLLGSLDILPSDSIINRLARVLPVGRYYLVIIEGVIRKVDPGTDDDYFATDVVRLFGLEPPDYQKPSGPDTPYYRFGQEHEIERTGRLTGPHKALATAVVMPLHNPNRLNRDRIEYWKHQIASGVVPTAYAISIVDDQAPAMDQVDSTYPYLEQFLFANCLIDGHHRVQAASDMGVPVRLLSFVATEYSLINKADDFVTIIEPFMR
jgi:hypothetical protein